MINDITKIAGHLPSWTLVATKLDMGEEDIQEIQASSKVAANQRKEFLKKGLHKIQRKPPMKGCAQYSLNWVKKEQPRRFVQLVVKCKRT